MTTHGTAQLMAAAGAWINCRYSQMEHLQSLEEWRSLAGAISESASCKSRQMLSHHTTSHCQLRDGKGQAPITSLADHGMSNPQQWGDRWWIHAQLPNTFAAGDNISIDYWGPYPDGATSAKEAIEMACEDSLMLLLAIAPNGVQLAPGSFRRGSLPHIRNLAGELSHAVQQEEVWHHLTQFATAAMARRLPSPPG